MARKSNLYLQKDYIKQFDKYISLTLSTRRSEDTNFPFYVDKRFLIKELNGWLWG